MAERFTAWFEQVQILGGFLRWHDRLPCSDRSPGSARGNALPAALQRSLDLASSGDQIANWWVKYKILPLDSPGVHVSVTQHSRWYWS